MSLSRKAITDARPRGAKRRGVLSVLALLVASCTASFTNPNGGNGPFDSGIIPSGSWSTARLEREFICFPGSRVRIACGACGLGRCEGDPVLRICSSDQMDPSVGLANCRNGVGVLGENDDDRTCANTGLCSLVSFVCPARGTILAISRGIPSTQAYICQVEQGAGG